MAQEDYEVTVDVERPAGAKDGRGGKTYPYAAVVGLTGLTATLHIRSMTSLARFEQSVGGMESGPGVMTQTKPFFKFLSPFPAVQVNDQIKLAAAFVLNGVTVYAAGTKFIVQTRPRVYSRTMQVDVEIVA